MCKINSVFVYANRIVMPGLDSTTGENYRDIRIITTNVNRVIPSLGLYDRKKKKQ